MGGAFSNGQDNDELVDNLVDSGYIRSKNIEYVFRAVDRGDYFLSHHKEDAYKDFAWKHDNIHLSAPCIYCEVMEELSLEPGLSFLNLGSGTGYLSTMAGLILTQNGVNHGIELYEDCVEYANDRLDEFKQKSLALDQFDFCEPIFMQGNCLNVVQGKRYDRVYCGATCPESHEAVIKEFVKVGGILVMPYKDHLVRAKRVSENLWESVSILPVSFANLVVPKTNEASSHLPDCVPLTLQELCRSKIRRRLRQNVGREHPDLEICKPITLERNPRSSPPTSQFIIPIFDDSDDETLPNSNDEESHVRRTQLLLNVDSTPGENLRTTLQFMRAVIQPRRRSTVTETENNNDREGFYDINWLDDEESPSTEDTNFSSEVERQDSESSSDSACDKSECQNFNLDNNVDKNEEKPVTSGLSAYSNMSESESESDTENQSPTPLIIEQRRKANRKETLDSGIVEDACAIDNDEVCLDSDTDLVKETPPIKHKRSCSSSSNCGNNSNCSASSSGSNNNNSSSEPRCKRPIKIGIKEEKDFKMGHYVDTNAFSSYMKEKIYQLPLPVSLKFYMNYNRTL